MRTVKNYLYRMADHILSWFEGLLDKRDRNRNDNDFTDGQEIYQ